MSGEDQEYNDFNKDLIEALKLNKKKKKRPKDKPQLPDLEAPVENGNPEANVSLSPTSPTEQDGEPPAPPLKLPPRKKPNKHVHSHTDIVTPVSALSTIAIIAKYEEFPKKKKRKKRNDALFDNVDITNILASMGLDNTGKTFDANQSGLHRDNYDSLQSYGYTDREYTYDELLARAFAMNPKKGPVEKKKLVIKPPQVVRIGARTSFVNFKDTCKTLHRQPRHLLEYLMTELGAFGAIDGNNQLIIKGKFNGAQIETVLRAYIREYVICHTCRSPDTVLQKDHRLHFLQCETCGSRCAVNSIRQGYVANVSRRTN
ncbi:Eukaryotic translation initiation factor 2 subunit 2-like [Oopsacas minuta]|uniref:Eukaryotic translation initiation factor 2 subunit 2 n=1 Tax=Oopsacas minuta TaxID=111878 RepID=A0AAV7JXT6_9METZ|nr:Eukaryotic translation initiation factor 2 subunit 2-like [Oopsacas minuta]